MWGFRRSARLLGACIGTPLVFALATGVAGVGEAKACSYATWDEPIWSSLSYGGSLSSAGIITSHDGFHFITGTFHTQTPAQALAQLAVEVQDASGQLVPGTPRMLKTNVYDEHTEAWVGWASDISPLLPGDYDVKVSAPGPNGEQLETSYALLVTSSPPAPVALPVLEVASYESYGMSTGPEVSCEHQFESCDPYTVTFGRNETFFPSLRIRQHTKATGHTVLWEYRYASASTGPSLQNSVFPTLASHGPDANESRRLVFASSSQSYCVTASVRDLKTTSELTQELCFSAEAPTTTLSEHPLKDCTAPPEESLLEQWCAVSDYASSNPVCSKFADAGTDGGAAGGGNAGSAGHDDAGTPLSDGGVSRTPPEPSSSAGCQCALGGPRRDGLVGLGALAVSLLIGLRRKRAAKRR